VGFEKRQDTVVEHVGSDQGVLSIVELGRGDLGVGVDKRLLVDASNALERADIEGVLGAQIEVFLERLSIHFLHISDGIFLLLLCKISQNRDLVCPRACKILEELRTLADAA
jgi:hypothetical protein